MGGNAMFDYKKLLSSLLVVSVFLGVAGCSSSEASGSDESSSATVVKVGTGIDTLPYCYLNEDDEYDGFDVAVARAIDEKLDDYTFEFEGGDFPTTLSNLESGKVQMACYEYEVNEERKEKFIYGDVGYIVWDTFIVTDGDQVETIANFDELSGSSKKVYVTTGTNQAAMASEYLAEHEGAFELVYGEYTNEQIVQALQSGAVDAYLAPKYQIDNYNRSFSSNLELGAESVHNSNAYFLFNKDADETLITAVNEAMLELKEDGTMQEISEKYLQGDYVPED